MDIAEVDIAEVDIVEVDIVEADVVVAAAVAVAAAVYKKIKTLCNKLKFVWICLHTVVIWIVAIIPI